MGSAAAISETKLMDKCSGGSRGGARGAGAPPPWLEKIIFFI